MKVESPGIGVIDGILKVRRQWVKVIIEMLGWKREGIKEAFAGILEEERRNLTQGAKTQRYLLGALLRITLRLGAFA